MCLTVIGLTGRPAFVEPCGRRARDDGSGAPPDSVIVMAGVPLPFGMVAAVPADGCAAEPPPPRGHRARHRWQWSFPLRASGRPSAVGVRA